MMRKSYFPSKEVLASILLGLFIVQMVIFVPFSIKTSAKTGIFQNNVTHEDGLMVPVSKSSLKDLYKNVYNSDNQKKIWESMISEGEVIVVGSKEKIQNIISNDYDLQSVNLFSTPKMISTDERVFAEAGISDSEIYLVRSPFVNNGLSILQELGHSTKQMIDRFRIYGIYAEPNSVAFPDPDEEVTFNNVSKDISPLSLSFNDPLLPMQNNMRIIKADQETPGKIQLLPQNKVVYAVLGTGVDYINNIDLQNQVLLNNDPPNGVDDDGDGVVDNRVGVNVADEPFSGNSFMTFSRHETTVSCIVNAEGNNGFATVGVTEFNAPKMVQALPIKISNREDGMATTVDLIEALTYVYNRKIAGVNIVAVNISYAGFVGSFLVAKMVAQLNQVNVNVIVAAGNGFGSIEPKSLADYVKQLPNGMVVSATDLDGSARAVASNVDEKAVFAPQAEFVSLQNGAITGLGNTSGATPHVTGLSLLLHLTGRFPSAFAVKQQIFFSCNKMSGLPGPGLVDVQKAIMTDSTIAEDQITVKSVVQNGKILKVKIATNSGPVSLFVLTNYLDEVSGVLKKAKGNVYTYSFVLPNEQRNDEVIITTENGGLAVAKL
jgi:hypothetical protein